MNNDIMYVRNSSIVYRVGISRAQKSLSRVSEGVGDDDRKKELLVVE